MNNKKAEKLKNDHSQDLKKGGQDVGLGNSQSDKLETAEAVGNIFVFLMPIFQFFTKCISKLPLLVLIISESALIPTYIIIVVVSFVLSMLPLPLIGSVPFFIFTVLEAILAVLCGILCVTSLLKAISVFKENKCDNEGYKRSNTVLSVILIIVSCLYTFILPIFMVLNIVDLVLSLI